MINFCMFFGHKYQTLGKLKYKGYDDSIRTIKFQKCRRCGKRHLTRNPFWINSPNGGIVCQKEAWEIQEVVLIQESMDGITWISEEIGKEVAKNSGLKYVP